MNSTRLPRIIALLSKQALTAHEVAETVFCTQRSAQMLIAKLHRQGQVYISSWRRVNTVLVAVYRAGIGVDAVRGRAMTSTEKVRKWRAKESLDDHAFRMARERAKKWKIKRDPLVAALFGER